MKNTFTIAALFLCHMISYGQDYFSGRINYANGGLDKIYYDRTQEAIAGGVFQSTYKIMTESKKPMCTITLAHDRANSIVHLSVKTAAGETKETIIQYLKKESGLIFTDKGNSDTSLGSYTLYSYLFSFSDTSRDYPVAHAIKTVDGKQVELDPLTKLRIKKHGEVVRNLHPELPPAAIPAPTSAKVIPQAATDTFSSRLVHLRDSLYSKNVYYIDYIRRLKTEIDSAIVVAVQNDSLYKDEKRYIGEKKNNRSDGNGLLIDGKNIYSGYFVHGKFIAGKVITNTGETEYYGEFLNDSACGRGWLKYKNGSFLLGIFRNGILYDGVCLSKEKNGEIYFGNFKNNQRTGYGELRSGSSNLYYGEFANGLLTQGYSKEVDQFGYYTYSKIENGSKAAIDPQQAKDFFDVTALSPR